MKYGGLLGQRTLGDLRLEEKSMTAGLEGEDTRLQVKQSSSLCERRSLRARPQQMGDFDLVQITGLGVIRPGGGKLQNEIGHPIRGGGFSEFTRPRNWGLNPTLGS